MVLMETKIGCAFLCCYEYISTLFWNICQTKYCNTITLKMLKDCLALEADYVQNSKTAAYVACIKPSDNF